MSNILTPENHLEEAVPPRPEELFRLHRLCLWIYNSFTSEMKEMAGELAGAAATGLKKKDRQALLESLEEEMPVLMLIHALERLEKEPRLASPGLTELVRGLLLPCFSLCFPRAGERLTDPLTHLLERLDWYLDGGNGDLRSAFRYLAGPLLGSDLADEAPGMVLLNDKIIPLLDKKLETAFRYEFRV